MLSAPLSKIPVCGTLVPRHTAEREDNMSSELLDPAETSAKESVKEPSGIRGVLIGIGLALIVVAVVGGNNLFNYIAHPNVFDSGGFPSVSQIPIDTTQDSAIAVSTSASSATVTITSIKAIITKNTSQATVNVVFCQTSPGLDHAIGPTPDEQILNHCDALLPVEGATFHMLKHQDLFVARVTPHAYGIVKIDGFEVRYSSGIRHQTQIVGGSFDLSTP